MHNVKTTQEKCDIQLNRAFQSLKTSPKRGLTNKQQLKVVCIAVGVTEHLKGGSAAFNDLNGL